MPNIDLDQLGHVLQSLGERLLAWRDDTAARAVHEPNAFKTEVDRRAHEFLLEALSRLAPGLPVVSEEDDPAQLAAGIRPERYWLIDPLDGTASWHGGFKGFVTQVALIYGRQPVLGALHAPALGHTWLAARGRGATLDGQPLAPPRPRATPVFVDNTPTPHGITARVMAEMGATSYLESGSLGLKCMLVADGRADVFLKDVVVRDWDLAPAAAVSAELGVSLLGADGQPWRFDGPFEKSGGFVVAVDSATAEQVLKVWRHVAVREYPAVDHRAPGL